MLNKFKTYLESLGFSYRKELLIIIIINISCLLFAVLLFIFTKTLFIVLSALLGIVLVNGVMYFEDICLECEITLSRGLVRVFYHRVFR